MSHPRNLASCIASSSNLATATQPLARTRRWASTSAQHTASPPTPTSSRPAAERTSIKIENIPRTFTTHDVHRALTRMGAFKNGDVGIANITAEPQPTLAPRTSLLSRTTSFLVTFPNRPAAETARSLISSNSPAFLGITNEPSRQSRDSPLFHARSKAVVISGKERIDPATFYSRALMSGFIQENIFPRVDQATGKPIHDADLGKKSTSSSSSSSSSGTRYMTQEERLEAAAEYVQAYKEARIGPFGSDAKAQNRNEPSMSGRQVVMWGMPSVVQQDTWGRVLKGFKLAEEDAVFLVPKRTHGKRSSYIITLQNVNEAHRLARYLNMMDFKSDKSQGSQTLLRAQVLW